MSYLAILYNLQSKQSYIILLAFCCISFFLFSSCKKEQVNNSIYTGIIKGNVQKGPFVSGTQVTIYELNESLEQTGRAFSTTIQNNYGFFEIKNVDLQSNNVLLVATGFYYDETKGEISDTPLTLNCLTSLSKSTVNINILTDIEKRRVEYLFENGYSLTEAKEQAQFDALAVFGFQNYINNTQSENLNIFNNNEKNAILLAISILLQNNRSVGELTELINAIGNDIRENGNLDNTWILDSLYEKNIYIDHLAIRKDLMDRYRQLEINVDIPNFERFLDEFMFPVAEPPEIIGEIELLNSETSYQFIQFFIKPNNSHTYAFIELGEDTNYGREYEFIMNPFTGGVTRGAMITVFGLVPEGQYHFRAKLTNQIGTVYSDDYTFSLPPQYIDSITDIDGNIYKVIYINGYLWMAENLKTTHYRDGTPIHFFDENNSAWQADTEGAYAWYENDEDNKEIYGALYNRYAVINTKGLCPNDWYVTTRSDIYYFWNLSFNPNEIGGHLKESGIEYWQVPNTGASDSYQFKGRPGGIRFGDGSYHDIGLKGYWWTDDYLWYVLNHDNVQLDYESYMDTSKSNFGLSVRCVKFIGSIDKK